MGRRAGPFARFVPSREGELVAWGLEFKMGGEAGASPYAATVRSAGSGWARTFQPGDSRELMHQGSEESV